MTSQVTADALCDYVVGYLRRHQDWPRVKRVANRFRIRVSEVEDITYDRGWGGLMLTGYNFDLPTGELYVELTDPWEQG